jgi:membrane fusion protein (multidrug efflux system)
VLDAKLKLAQARLEKMRLLAPFDGVVGIRNFSVGDYVKDGVDLVNLEDVRRLKADFRLPERYFGRVRVGQAVEISPDALPDLHVAGAVESVNPRIDSNGRSVEIRAVLPNADNRLRPGMFVRVRVILGDRNDALVLPEEAIVPSGSDFFVFKVLDGKAQRVRVSTGVRRDGRVEVASGLQPGDQVVVAGQVRLAVDGQAVRIVASGQAGGTPDAAGAAPAKDAVAGATRKPS